jgi:hypothetical protein
VGYREDLAAGRIAFAHLIRVWHERNGWSHKVLPALAVALDLGRVHNSQISMLRNGKLASPGPEVFLALGRINRLLASEAGATGPSPSLRARLGSNPELLASLEGSALAVEMQGAPVPGPGEFLEVFVGLRLRSACGRGRSRRAERGPGPAVHGREALAALPGGRAGRLPGEQAPAARALHRSDGGPARLLGDGTRGRTPGSAAHRPRPGAGRSGRLRG